MVNNLGAIFRPTDSFRTEMVKTKTGENQLPGDLLIRNGAFYEIAALNQTGTDTVIVVDTETNVGHGAANVNIDQVREVLAMEWEICVLCVTGCNVGDLLKASATVKGAFDKYDPAVDTDGNKIQGKCMKLASEETYDVTKTLTNPGTNTRIIMLKYARRPMVDTA